MSVPRSGLGLPGSLDDETLELVVLPGALPAEVEIAGLYRRIVSAMALRDAALADGDEGTAYRHQEIADTVTSRMLDLAETVAVVRGIRPATP